MGEQIDMDVPNCPECGALSNDGLTCRERFHALLAMEGQDPELASRHCFTVACYNLQHPSLFIGEALDGLKASLKGLLDGTTNIDEIRRRTSSAYDGPKKVLQPAWGRQVKLRIWKMTTADVYRPVQPQGTAERVQKWAESISKEIP
jgi:hypothetical protein